ncbi:hypothetical protein WA026_006657 [Henosepilachna vigintioctopunctata]|uniref:Uncharacterized protein n=1 Tax=Henosepilachna vigintioctopunctata TaxID=420089 RepID=A0AAW1UGB7_9CUCU
MVTYLRKICEPSQIPRFNNILTFYQILGTQVTFTDNKIIFAIHIPILKTKILDFYHICPIIQQNKIFTPTFPYLARAGQEPLAQKEECPMVEEIYYCTNGIILKDKCTLQLLDGKPPNQCVKNDITFDQAIIEQVTRNEVLVIPVKSSRVISKCTRDQFMEINQLSSIKISENCQITINNLKFRNNEQVRRGTSLILPRLKIPVISSKNTFQSSNLTKIDFENLYEINNLAKQLTPIEKPQVPDAISTSIFSTILIIIILNER